MPAADVVKLLAAGAAGGGVITQGVRMWLRRPLEKAKADRIRAEGAAEEVRTARGLMRDMNRELNGIRTRVLKLEERERHMLARVASHEGWDRVAYTLLVTHHDPLHPLPPPITGPDLDPDNRDAYGEDPR